MTLRKGSRSFLYVVSRRSPPETVISSTWLRSSAAALSITSWPNCSRSTPTFPVGFGAVGFCAACFCAAGFCAADFCAADFCGVDLGGADFGGTDFCGTAFGAADFSVADFSAAIFCAAGFAAAGRGTSGFWPPAVGSDSVLPRSPKFRAECCITGLDASVTGDENASMRLKLTTSERTLFRFAGGRWGDGRRVIRPDITRRWKACVLKKLMRRRTSLRRPGITSGRGRESGLSVLVRDGGERRGGVVRECWCWRICGRVRYGAGCGGGELYAFGLM